MTTQTVNACFSFKLDCCYPNAEVILCLQSSALLAAIPCPEDAEQSQDLGELGFIEAVLTGCFPIGNSCGATSQWQYVFSYDDTLLADPEVPLTSADITGAFCQGCLTSWISSEVGSEVYLETDGEGNTYLVSQHGCRYLLPAGGGEGGLPLLVSDSDTVSLSISGSPQQTLSASVIVSPAPNNALIADSTGLFVAEPPAGQDPLAVTDTSSLDLTITAGVAQVLSGVVRISADPGNLLELRADGLYVAEGTPPPSTDTGTSTEDTSSQIGNPGMGIQSVNSTSIQTNAAGNNPNNYPLPTVAYRSQWADLEPTEGAYNFTSVIAFFDQALAAGQLVNYRVYESDPGSGFGPPQYLYNYAGWRATQDDGGATAFYWCYWGNSSVQNAHNNFLLALANAIGNHPALGTIDCGWGVYSENNYSGTHYNGTSNGSVPAVSVGSELPNLSVSAYQGFYQRYRNAFPSQVLVTFPDTQGSFDYPVGALNFGVRADGWGYRSNPVSCPAAGVQMCTLYPNTFVSPGTYPNVWQQSRVDLETWNFIYSGSGSWLTNGWDYTSSFQWAWQQAHASELNIKGRFQPTGGMKTAMEAMMLKIGYRYVLRSISHYVTGNAGTNVTINTVWENVGCAPNYLPFTVMYRFVGASSGLVYKYSSTSQAKWLPGGTVSYAHSVPLPTWLAAETYDIYAGIGDQTQIYPTIQQANNGDDGRFWYSLGTQMGIVNASPTTVPTTDYAIRYVSASSQKSTSTSQSFRVNGTDWSIGVKFKLGALGTTRTILAKGGVTAGTQEFRIYYNTATGGVSASWSNGSTIFTVNHATTLVMSTLYSVVVKFNNTTKVLSISLDGGAFTNGSAGTGNIPAGSNVMTVGADTSGNYFTGDVTDLAIWLVQVSNTQNTNYAAVSGGVSQPVRYSELLNSTKFGMLEYFDMANDVGNQVGSRRGLSLTPANSPIRVALN
jgi:hypothetical protein